MHPSASPKRIRQKRPRSEVNRQRSAAGSFEAFEDPDQLPADPAHLQDAGAVISPHSDFAALV